MGVHSLHEKGGVIPKKRRKVFCCTPNILCVLDAKFNVDYDFAIKHDLIPSSDQLMGVHILHEKGGHDSSKKGEIFCCPPIFYVY